MFVNNLTAKKKETNRKWKALHTLMDSKTVLRVGGAVRKGNSSMVTLVFLRREIEERPFDGISKGGNF